MKMNAASQDGAANTRERNKKTFLGVLMLPNAMIDQVRTPLFINADHILPEAGFSYMASRMRGKISLQFHLKFISICLVQFIHDILPVYQDMSVKVCLTKESADLQAATIKHPSKTPCWPLRQYCQVGSFILSIPSGI